MTVCALELQDALAPSSMRASSGLCSFSTDVKRSSRALIPSSTVDISHCHQLVSELLTYYIRGNERMIFDPRQANEAPDLREYSPKRRVIERRWEIKHIGSDE